MNKRLKAGIYAVVFSLFITLLPNKSIAYDLERPFIVTMQNHYTAQELFNIFEEFLNKNKYFGGLFKVALNNNNSVGFLPLKKNQVIVIWNDPEGEVITFMSKYVGKKNFSLQKVNRLNELTKCGNFYVDGKGKELWITHSLIISISGLSIEQIIAGFTCMTELQELAKEAGLVN